MLNKSFTLVTSGHLVPKQITKRQKRQHLWKTVVSEVGNRGSTTFYEKAEGKLLYRFPVFGSLLSSSFEVQSILVLELFEMSSTHCTGL